MKSAIVPNISPDADSVERRHRLARVYQILIKASVGTRAVKRAHSFVLTPDRANGGEIEKISKMK